MPDPHGYIDQNHLRFREELFEFLRIPSVSARSENQADVRRTAEWFAEQCRAAGLTATVHATAGHPIVLAEWRQLGPGAPTALIYGHYDVQPVEPLDLWSSPPFEPVVRAGRIYGRGSVDDKGQLFLHLKAIEAHIRTNGRLPCNLVLIAEGEEEVGSSNLMPFVKQHTDELRCHAVVISDTTMIGPNLPTIGVSLRGLAYVEVRVLGPAQDLHSGSYGGAVLNPATALARIIASFHDENWHVKIPGFYDAVNPAQDFRAAIKKLPFDEAAFLSETGSPAVAGEKDFSTLERIWIRPTVEINGLLSGYTAEGSKTVLPAHAMAKVSCRLVPDQDPDRIADLLQKHIRSVAPQGVRIEIDYLHGGKPWRARTEGPLYDAAAAALEKAFGRKPVYAGEGGSIPIVPEFESVLNAPVLLMGFGLPGENAHAPDEWMSVENFEKGTHAAAALLDELGRRIPAPS
ncbi:MAG TPA: dipeptidase [Longimicrobiales bacterium]|nr:dipeptidase [Longimicrobiales bacterium]